MGSGLVKEQARLSIVFTESVLGTVPKDQTVYATFIESKKPEGVDDQETATVEQVEERGWDGFHVDPETGELFAYDYQLKGALKEAATILKGGGQGEGGAELKAFRSKIENYVYVFPRRLYFLDGSGQRITAPAGVVERPLRAQTMQGPRVTVRRSDQLLAGTQLRAEIQILQGPISLKHVRQCLDLGEYRGMGQWRTGSHGRFTYTLEEEVRWVDEHGEPLPR